MANAYSYTFDGSVSQTYASSSAGPAGPISISGNFVADFDQPYYQRITSGSVNVGGLTFTPSYLSENINPDGSITYDASFMYKSQYANENRFLDLYYKGYQPSTFTNARYLVSITDYSTAPSSTYLATYQGQQVAVSSVSVCFGTGTLIRTTRGEVAVEDLRVGDRAVTASGRVRPITWIGHRDLDGAGAMLPHDQQPVRVRVGAFGPGLPARDLCLSPGHPVLVGADASNEGGVLVPVMCLVNGTSITREPRGRVTYWHVELDAHDILLAEGLPAESYLDWGDRPFFTEGSDHALHNPDFVVLGLSARCRPVAVDGPMVEAERARLDAVFAAELAGHSVWVEADAWLAA